jgi:hypothetical protein
MLLMIDQLQVGLRASHHGPRTRANAGDSGSWSLTPDPGSAERSGYQSGYRFEADPRRDPCSRFGVDNGHQSTGGNTTSPDCRTVQRVGSAMPGQRLLRGRQAQLHSRRRFRQPWPASKRDVALHGAPRCRS